MKAKEIAAIKRRIRKLKTETLIAHKLSIRYKRMGETGYGAMMASIATMMATDVYELQRFFEE